MVNICVFLYLKSLVSQRNAVKCLDCLQGSFLADEIHKTIAETIISLQRYKKENLNFRGVNHIVNRSTEKIFYRMK